VKSVIDTRKHPTKTIIFLPPIGNAQGQTLHTGPFRVALVAWKWHRPYDDGIHHARRHFVEVHTQEAHMKAAVGILIVSVLLAAAGAGWADDAVEPSLAADLLPPRLVMSAGRPVIAEGRFAALTVGDFDEDGKPDLLVGQKSEGLLHIYPNTGTAARPEFGHPMDFVAGGERACIPSGCYTGFNPQLVDFDGDGRTDVLSPSFNGGICLFRRTGDGTFAEVDILEYRDGRPIRFRYNGTVVACDWDSDGDLDLLTRGGLPDAGKGVNLLRNEGSRRKPAYGTPVGLTAGGEPLLGKPCCVVDWDGDGKDDLLTCSRRVYWYRNRGKTGEPVLQAAKILVPSDTYRKVERRHDEPWRVPDAPSHIDSVCAADLNDDGRLDLLVTSSWSDAVELPEPTEEEKAADNALSKEASALLRQYWDLCKPSANESGEAYGKRQKACLHLWKKYAALNAERQRLQPRQDFACVWLFERKGAAAK
jgi:hypothetical protein